MEMQEQERNPATPRERARAATIDQAKAIALRQLAAGGVEAISLKAIALELGLTGPAIYRYFANRNELLTELIVDAYRDMAGALHEAETAAASKSPQQQLHAIAGAYRQWGLAQPHRYRLLYAAPVPGYDANAARLVEAAGGAMAIFLDVFGRIPRTGSPAAALGRPLAKQLRDWGAKNALEPTEPEVLHSGLIAWTRLHGFVSLEVEGAFASMGIDPDALFEREVDALAG